MKRRLVQFTQGEDDDELGNTFGICTLGPPTKLDIQRGYFPPLFWRAWYQIDMYVPVLASHMYVLRRVGTMAEAEVLDDIELVDELKKLGYHPPGPITNTTRCVYVNKLRRLSTGSVADTTHHYHTDKGRLYM